MTNTALTRSDLITFFSLQATTKDTRPLSRVLRALEINLRGGSTRWSVIWHTLGLAADQDPEHHAELMAPLLTARATAGLLGHTDPSIIYRWSKGKVPKDHPLFPAFIDLSGGRNRARAMRWRKAEILAWQTGKPQPLYKMPAPIFGAIGPTR